MLVQKIFLWKKFPYGKKKGFRKNIFLGTFSDFKKGTKHFFESIFQHGKIKCWNLNNIKVKCWKINDFNVKNWNLKSNKIKSENLNEIRVKYWNIVKVHCKGYSAKKEIL